MQTSCPACRTTFRVSQNQLGQRRGLVRCGGCNAVFNAYDTLLPELEEAPASSLPDVGAVDDKLDLPTQPEAEEETTISVPFGSESEFELEPAFVPAFESVPDEPPTDETPADQASGEEEERKFTFAKPDSEATPSTEFAESETRENGTDQDETGEGESTPVSAAASMLESTPDFEVRLSSAAAQSTSNSALSKPFAAESSEAILLSDLPNRLRDARKPLAWWKQGLYSLTILLLVLTLLLQLAYFLRAELAAAWPATRPLLNELCDPLNCVVPLPQQLTRQTIASSSLEHDPEQKSRVRLTLLLANRTDLTQTWPHIVLTLSDVRESPVAQRAFSPNEYLPRNISERAGFPPQSEQEAALELDLGSLVASSYLLDVKYP